MKKGLLFVLIGFSNQCLFGQQDIRLENIVPPSPEAAAFAKYGSYPIGTYTGRPDISIPIYDIKDGNLLVPISLSYDATGIRVNEMAGWAGMNWSLNAGGMISQMIVGQPDIIDTSIPFAAVPPRASEITDNSTYFNYLQALVDHDVAAPANPDADPDKFFYSFNGRSGSFVLDRNRNIMQIPKTSLKISVIGSMQGFTITDETGTSYIFSSLEKTETYNYFAAGPSPVLSASGSVYRNQTTGFYLTEIVSNDGIQHIYFTYQSGLTASKDDQYDEAYGSHWSPGGGSYTQKVNYHEYRWTGVKRVVTTPRLKSISFSNGKVEFSLASGRQDDAALASSSRLDEITVYQKAGANYLKIKSFKLIHGYYNSAATYGQYSGFPNETVDRYRLRLDTLKLMDSFGSEISNYTFSYNNTPLPPKTSCSQDWWGYYNGKFNSSLVPTTTIPDGNGGNITIGGADRSSDESYMKAGILEKIKYPTGGYTVFETESHKISEDYLDVFETHNVNAQGTSSNNFVVQTFIAPQMIDNASGVLNISIGPYSASYPQPFVKIKNMSTGVQQTYTSPDMTQWYSVSVPYSFTPGTTYELTASCYVNQSYGTANLTASFKKSIYSPHTNPVGGLRIKSIKNYTSDNTLANEESYTYGPNEDGGGVFVGINGNAYNYQRSETACIPYVQYCISDHGYNEVFSGGALYDQALVQGSPVVYTDVVKYYGNATGNIGKTVYNYGTASQQLVETRPLPAGNELANNQGIIIINNSWKKGQLLMQQDYKFANNTYNLVRETQNTYNTIYTDTTYGLIAQSKFDRIYVCSICARNFSDYAWAEYPVYTGYVQLAQTVKNQYSSDNDGIIQTVVTNTYDNNHKDIEVKTNTISSKGEALEMEKKYPFNKAQLLTSITPAESTALDDMVTKNIIVPVEEIGRRNSVQISLKKTSYEYVNGSTIAPVNIKFQNGSYPLETRLLFTKYDAFGNLLEQQKVDDQKKSYIWDYQNRYPIAEVSNASQTDIAFTSFEADGSGNWTIGSTARDTVNFLAGQYSYLLSSGNIYKSGLTIGNSYIVSYWSKAGSYSITGGTGSIIAGRSINGWTYYQHNLTAVATTLIISGSGNIDELRLYPLGSQITSFTYSPLVGMTSMDDANGEIAYYEYDGLQRLKNIKDYQGNIIKNYQYNYANNCGLGCSVLPMQTFNATNTLSYPVGVFNVNGKLLGNAGSQAQYISTWMADTVNSHTGTIVAGSDSMHFNFTVNSGRAVPPALTGCRYYQYDLAYNQLDGMRNINGVYVDFGDGTGMRLGRTNDDSSMVVAPNTSNWLVPGWSLGGWLIYWVHDYPDSSLKTITIYHNDGIEYVGLDNRLSPANSMMRLRNIRGNFPQHTPLFGSSVYQQASALTVANIYNWNSISSITSWGMFSGDYTNPCMHLNFAQDFMAGNRNLRSINTTRGLYLDGYTDTTFKISRLKSDWNTYFTNLQTLVISDDHWNREDLSALPRLDTVVISAASLHHSLSQTNNPLVPIPVSVLDNIINQVAAGSSQTTGGGLMNLLSGGTNRSSASDAAFNQLKSRGWTIIINNVTY